MPRRSDSLAGYRAKRDMRRSGEPEGRRQRSAAEPGFVVQHHLATSDHYDFRLEVDGLLKSWAVPKGPSTNPKDKRMARSTEDHPLDYAHFEGVVPDGEYGAGPVQVWDIGTYRNRTENDGEPVPMDRALAAGHATFELDGTKLAGGFALTRIRTGKNETWLLVKTSDDQAHARNQPVRKQPQSALSGETIEQIEAADRNATNRSRA